MLHKIIMLPDRKAVRHRAATHEVAKMPKTESEWKEIGAAKVWLPEEEDDEIQGEVLGIQQGAYGMQLVLKTKDGELLTPSHKVLQNRLALVKVGDVVKIVYTGKEKSKQKGHQDMSMYSVFVKGN